MKKVAPLAILWVIVIAFSHLQLLGAIITSPNFSALQDAVASGGYIRIAFDGSITFPSELSVSKDVEIDASGRVVTFDGSLSNRLFAVNGAHLKLTSLTLARGKIRPESTSPNGLGGAVFLNNAQLTMKDSALIQCQATGYPPHVTITPLPNYSMTIHPAGGALGGAIAAANSTLDLVNCSFSGNSALGPDSYYRGGIEGPRRMAGGPAFGGAIWTTNSLLRLTNCLFNQNLAFSGRNFESAITPAGAGGAIHAEGSGSLAAHRSIFTANTTDRGIGGALSLNVTTRLSSCVFSSNVSTGQIPFTDLSGAVSLSSHGGAIVSSAGIAITETLFFSNSVHGPPAQYANPPISQYSAGVGKGGALALFGPSTLTNCSFYLNHAVGGDGKYIYGPVPSPFGLGGAIYILKDRTSLAHISLASNYVAQSVLPATNSFPQGDAIYIEDAARVEMAASIIGAHVNNVPVVFGNVVDRDFNLSIDSTPAFTETSSVNNTDPLIQFPQPNAAPILELKTGSPALDRVPAQLTATDLRGIVRPLQSCDSGCVEMVGEFEADPVSLPDGGVEFQLGFFGHALKVHRTTDLDTWVEVAFTETNSAMRQVYRPSNTSALSFYKFQLHPSQ